MDRDKQDPVGQEERHNNWEPNLQTNKTKMLASNQFKEPNKPPIQRNWLCKQPPFCATPLQLQPDISQQEGRDRVTFFEFECLCMI